MGACVGETVGGFWGKGAMYEAFLVQEDDPEFRVAINGGITLGRTKDNQIVLADKLASRRHAAVICQNGVYQLSDLDSTNGTYVNETAMKKAELVAGDKIRIGKSCFRFEIVGEPKPVAKNGAEVAPVDAIVVEEVGAESAQEYAELHGAHEGLRVFPKYLRLEGHAEIHSAGGALVDVYDVWPMNDTVIALFLGTLEPKEMLDSETDLAVLAKASLLGALRACAEIDAAPADVLNRLSAACVRLPEITGPVNAVYAQLDRQTGALALALAGHPVPVRFNRLSVELLDTPVGAPLGPGGGDYAGAEHLLEQGDGLLLYTNGVVDARRDAEATPVDQAATYGLAAVRGLVKGRNGDSPAAIVRALLDDVVAFCKPSTPQDDCAAMAVRYRGKTG